MFKSEAVVVGAGVIGLSIARALALRGVEVLVPYEWEIVGEVVPVMGGFEVKVRPAAPTGKQLIVRGAAVMGGVEVKSAPGRRS